MAYISGTQPSTVYTPGKQLGSGGEGAVYDIVGLADKVLKIYHPSHFATDSERGTMERKLRAMLKMNVDTVVEGKLRLAWPTDIVYENGKMVGFVMPKITAPLKIFDLYRPIVPKTSITKKRDTIYPGYHWKYSVQFAYNLAWVVDYVHRKGIVIGDLNDNNILADPQTGAVILIDCDSFDIRDPGSGEHFGCKCALPDILAPELQNFGVLANATFTRESDYFSLAIHIFRLLMNGEDPFGGKVTTGTSLSAVPANDAIVNGECPYVRPVPGKTLHPRMLPMSFLPVSLQGLFRRTFDYTAVNAKSRISSRSSAREWMNALLLVGQINPTPPLVTCPKHPDHVYPSHNGSCPWCTVLAALNQKVTPPPSRSAQPQPRTTPTPSAQPQPRTTPTSSTTQQPRPNTSSTTQQSRTNTSSTTQQSRTNTSSTTQQPRTNPTPSTTQRSSGGVLGIIALILVAALIGSCFFFRDEMKQVWDTVVEYVEPLLPKQGDTPNPETGYILPDSSTRYLTEEDLAGLTDQELILAKNELFARHGRKFETKEIRDYFLKTSWYEELYEPDVFDQNVHSFFNDYEWANLIFIRTYRGEIEP